MLLTRSPLITKPKFGLIVRLACVKHAASVHPEPGSNSPFKRQVIAYLLEFDVSGLCQSHPEPF